MITYNNRQFWALLFRVRGTVYRGILLRCLIASIIGIFAALLQDRGVVGSGASYLNESNFQMLYTFIGTVLGLLLSFRLSMAYSRWDEANVQLGSFRQSARNIVSSFAAYLEPNADDPSEALAMLRETRRLIVALCVLIVKDLHDDADIDDLVTLGYLSVHHAEQISETRTHLFAGHIMEQHVEARPARVRPALLTVMIRRQMAGLLAKNYIPSHLYFSYDARVDELSRIFSSLLRIAATPMPFIMNHFLKVVMTLYVFTVPFGIVAHLEWLTPPFIFLIAFLFFGADQIAVDIEEPLGGDLNDIDPGFHIVRLDIETAAIVAHIERLHHVDRKNLEAPHLACNWKNLALADEPGASVIERRQRLDSQLQTPYCDVDEESTPLMRSATARMFP
eukprot:m.116446 g.116446  ORF g.116446 m.116446 type:complete len:393 (+) comp15402_c0_seq1:255-1433(+)